MKKYKIIPISLIFLGFSGFVLSILFDKINALVYKQLDFKTLSEIIFGVGLFLFNFSKSEMSKDVSKSTFIINSYILAAIFSTLIVYSLIQNINANFQLNLLVVPLLFLVIQTILNIFFNLKKYSRKFFIIIVNIIALIWLIYFLIKILI